MIFSSTHNQAVCTSKLMVFPLRNFQETIRRSPSTHSNHHHHQFWLVLIPLVAFWCQRQYSLEVNQGSSAGSSIGIWLHQGNSAGKKWKYLTWASCQRFYQNFGKTNASIWSQIPPKLWRHDYLKKAEWCWRFATFASKQVIASWNWCVASFIVHIFALPGMQIVQNITQTSDTFTSWKINCNTLGPRPLHTPHMQAPVSMTQVLTNQAYFV